MAADKDDQKPGEPGKDERPGGRDRRRSPVTIDLTAAPIPGKGASAHVPPPATEGRDAPRPATPSMSGEPAAGPSPPPRAAFAGLRPQNLDRDAWIGLGSAAALGGVIALILLMVLQAVGAVPAPGATVARQAADQAKTAANGIAALDRRLSAVEAMTDALPALRSDVTGLGARVAALDQATTAAASKADLEQVRSELAAMKTRLDQASAAPTVADLAALGTRVNRLEGALAGAAGVAASQPQAAPPAPSDIDQRVAALSARLDAAEAALNRLSSANATVASGTASVRTAVLVQLKTAVDSGKPFTAELDALANFGNDPAVVALRPFAGNGVATREALRADFQKTSDAILGATQGSGDDSIFGRIAAGARGLVSVRPAGPVAGTDAPAIVSRMTADVAMGDLAAALVERDGLPTAAKDASAGWAMRAAARVKADMLLGTATTLTGATGAPGKG